MFDPRERIVVEFAIEFLADAWRACAPDTEAFNRRVESFNAALQMHVTLVAERATQPRSRQRAVRLANRGRRIAWYAAEYHPGSIFAAAKAIEADLRRPNQFRTGSPRRIALEWILVLSGDRALGHKALEQIIRDHA